MQNIPTFLQWIRPMSYSPEVLNTLTPNKTEQQVKTVTQNRVTQTEKNKRTQEQFFQDVTKAKNTLNIDDKQAVTKTAEYYSAKWVEVPWLDFESILKEPEREEVNWFISETKEAIWERVWEVWQIFKRWGEQKSRELQDLVNTAKSEGITKAMFKWLKSALTPDILEKNKDDTIVQLWGQVIWAWTDVIWEGIENLAQVFTPKEVENKIEQAVQSIWNTDIVQNLVSSWDKFSMENPEKARNIAWIVNISEILPIWKWAWLWKKAISKEAKEASIKVMEKQVDDLVLQISQWTKADIPKVKKAIQNTDISDIDSYEQLSERFSDKISILARKQDEILPDDKIYSIDEVTTSIGWRKTNYAKQALDDLESVWLKENDLELLAKVDELKSLDKFSTKDLNDLARFYGTKFKNKAFSKRTWEPLSSVSAARFENNRKGLKNIVRDLLPDDTMKTLDSEISTLYTAQWLADDMVRKVDNLRKKVTDRNIVEQFGRWVADIIDAITFGWVRAFLWRMLPSNVWLKTMNSLDLEKALKKNLEKFEKTLQKIEKAKEPSKIKEAVEELWRQLNISREQINEQALKGKEALGNKLDDLADIENVTE